MRHRVLIFLFIFILAGVEHSWSFNQSPGKLRTFKGAFFEIKYPAGFIVRPSIKNGQNYDSAFFTSPDGSVEFYIYSPQWNGEPVDISIDPNTETYASQMEAENKGTRTRQYTIEAKDHSYTRSYADTEDTLTNTRKVFGIKYRDKQAYNEHRADYLKFKSSLRQFGD